MEETMAPLRVVVQFTADSPQIADKQVQALAARAGSVEAEAGCLQFEVFRSVARPEKYALIELWESQAVLDERQRARGGGPPPLPEGVSRVIEHYDQH
jgi:quinol monooxygenase YgiN